MTDRELMQQALEALADFNYEGACEKEIAALRAALAEQPAEQEPVAWGVFDGPNLHDVNFTEEDAQEMVRLKGDGSVVKPLYTSPQPQMQPCVGRNCGSTNPNLHSAECFEDYDKATGADRNRTWTQAHWTEYEHSIAAAEREACAKLCEKLAEDPMMSSGLDAIYCAEAIRARGQA